MLTSPPSPLENDVHYFLRDFGDGPFSFCSQRGAPSPTCVRCAPRKSERNSKTGTGIWSAVWRAQIIREKITCNATGIRRRRRISRDGAESAWPVKVSKPAPAACRPFLLFIAKIYYLTVFTKSAPIRVVSIF